MGWKSTIYASAPGFVVDPNSVDYNTGRQIDWSKVPDTYKPGTSYTITAPDGANSAATSITVTATLVDLPVGTILDWTGTGEFSKLTAAAAAGATSLSVEALDAAIESGDTATFKISYSNEKVIPAGTVMCELSTGKIVPRAARPGSETAIGLLASTATENAWAPNSDSLSGYGIIVGGVIYETLLPETITSYKSELQTAGVGTGFSWQTYADSREV